MKRNLRRYVVLLATMSVGVLRPERIVVASSAAMSVQAIYNAVASRNIFLNGDQLPLPPDAPGKQPIPPGRGAPTASQLVLTGVSLEDNQKVAFLDDRRQYTTQRVKVGDAISNGRVVNITLDALDYKDSAGRTIRIEVGFNLAGGNVGGATSESAASTRPAISGPRAPGESIEDHLQRRRAAQLSH